MVVKSQEELVRRLKALPKHARDEHEWEGGRCEFHTLEYVLVAIIVRMTTR